MFKQPVSYFYKPHITSYGYKAKYAVHTTQQAISPKPQNALVNWFKLVKPLRCPNCFECIHKKTGEVYHCFVRAKHAFSKWFRFYTLAVRGGVLTLVYKRYNPLMSQSVSVYIPVNKSRMVCRRSFTGRIYCTIFAL